MVNILLIDNFDSFTYNLVQLLEETMLCNLTVIRYDKVTEADIEAADGFVISPGPGTPADFQMLEKWVAKYYKSKSILGVCMGYEAIGLAFGAKLYNLGTVFHGITKTSYIIKPNHYFVKDIPSPFQAGLYHSWTLADKDFPQELSILSKSDDNVIMMVAHQNHNVVGVQFHPESIMTPDGGQMVKNWLERISI